MKSTRASPPPREDDQTTAPVTLGTPLEVIAADHSRARQIFADLEDIAASHALDRDLAQGALRFLNEDLGIHMRDASEDLFPLLRRRCPLEEQIDRAITRIRSDQESALALLPQIRSVLADCLDADRVPTRKEVTLVLGFTSHTRRHLVAQNAILLPLARVCLTEQDLESLCLRMQARRGLPPNIEACHA
jgi:hemerythrin-like domain-containing protein